MLLFSTVLDITEKLTKERFIRLVIEWNQSSPHEENVIFDMKWNGEHTIHFGNDQLWMDIVEYQDIIAVRYEKNEADGITWDTDYVMNFKTRKMAVRLDRSYREDAIAVDAAFSSPYFLSLLINKDCLKVDGPYPVSNRPILMNEDNQEELAKIILRKNVCRLPVVYVSKTIHNEDPIDVGALASRLKGVAHIVVQEDKEQNSVFREMCESQNEYYGAIGIYYPTQAAGHVRFLSHDDTGMDPILFRRVLRSVIQYSNAQQIDPLYTWQGVNNEILRNNLSWQIEKRNAAELARQRAEQETEQLLDSRDEEEKRIRKTAIDDAKAEANKILDGFDEDLKRLQKQIENLTHENERLQYENQGLRSKLDSSEAKPLLYTGDEYDYYPGEIKDLILAVLSDARANLPEKCRRLDIINDIISNNQYEGISEKKAEEVKRLLKNYDGMTPKLQQNLEALGFVFSEDTKHYKVTYYGDERYQTVYGKTPSDVRSGKNNAATTVKMVF